MTKGTRKHEVYIKTQIMPSQDGRKGLFDVVASKAFEGGGYRDFTIKMNVTKSHAEIAEKTICQTALLCGAVLVG